MYHEAREAPFKTFEGASLGIALIILLLLLLLVLKLIEVMNLRRLIRS